jgi:hypothetical protein
MVDLEPSRQLLIGDLKANECRYPTSEGRGHLFCGAKIAAPGCPYCAGHMSISYIPSLRIGEDKAA